MSQMSAEVNGNENFKKDMNGRRSLMQACAKDVDVLFSIKENTKLLYVNIFRCPLTRLFGYISRI